MAYSTISILAVTSTTWAFSNSNSFTITLTTSSYPDAVTSVQDIWKSGGCWAVDASNNSVWLPVASIQRIAIS